MTLEYADSNVWIAILQGESLSGDIREYFREVRQARKELITSVLTLHEISIRAFRKGQFARVDEYFLKVNTIAQVMQFTPDITKTSARLEAKFGEKNSIYGPRLSRGTQCTWPLR